MLCVINIQYYINLITYKYEFNGFTIKRRSRKDTAEL